MSIEIKINEDSIKRVEASVREVFNKVVKSPDLLNDMGKTIVEDIQFQTRRGKSIPNGLSKLKKITKKWAQRREVVAEAGGTHEAYANGRSNLTLSGQLLNSLKHFIIGPGQIEVRPDGRHEPYRYNLKEYFTRKKKKGRRINRGPVTGFDGGRGTLQFVNTGRSGASTIGDPISNEELAQYVAEQGRPFMGVTEKTKDRLKSKVLAAIRRSARALQAFVMK